MYGLWQLPLSAFAGMTKALAVHSSGGHAGQHDGCNVNSMSNMTSWPVPRGALARICISERLNGCDHRREEPPRRRALVCYERLLARKYGIMIAFPTCFPDRFCASGDTCALWGPPLKTHLPRGLLRLLARHTHKANAHLAQSIREQFFFFSMFRAGSSPLRVVRLSRGLATVVVQDAPKPQLKTRHDWAKPEIKAIYESPLLDLVFRAASVHRQYHDPTKIQLCTLMNIKSAYSTALWRFHTRNSLAMADQLVDVRRTVSDLACGRGLSGDVRLRSLPGSYCSQSSRYATPTKAQRLVDIEPVLEAARKAKENGSTRFCMGAAWRDLAGRKRGFERILTMVREVRAMGMEVCTTLGMLSPDQARQLKEAYANLFPHSRLALIVPCSGLTAYNHNLDTSREFYPSVSRVLYPPTSKLTVLVRLSPLVRMMNVSTRYRPSATRELASAPAVFWVLASRTMTA